MRARHPAEETGRAVPGVAVDRRQPPGPTAGWLRATPTLLVASLAGGLAGTLHVPLPWMLGPLFVVALLRVLGIFLQAPRGGREIGQWIIGSALGLYFTPGAIAAVLHVAPVIVVAGFFAIAVGYLSGWVLCRVGRVDFVTAFFCSVPGGATEMAFLGERHRARVDRVAAAQSLRILIVVAALPAIYQVLGVHGVDPYAEATRAISAPGLGGLAVATAAGGWLMARLRVGNAWLIGPLAVSIPLTAMGIDLSAIPRPVLNTSQVLLGCALASRFNPEFARAAFRFVAGVFAAVSIAMVVSAAFGWMLSRLTGLHWATLILATAPGGIAEMALTAKALDLGVPIVTAFHVTRLVMLVILTAPVYATVVRIGAGIRRGRREGGA